MKLHRSAWLGAAVLGLALSMTPPATSAPARDGAKANMRPGNRGQGMMEQLNLTPQQRQKVQALRKQQMQQMQALRTSKLTPEQRRARMQTLRQTHDKQLRAILTPAQNVRLTQLQSQRGGRRGGMDLNRMKQQLNLTAAQENKIRAILKKAEADQARLRPQGTPPNPAQRTKMRELRQRTMQQIQSVLTAEQRQKVQQMMGARGERGGMGRGPRAGR